MIYVRVCVMCGKSYIIGREYTCSEECHEKFVEKLIEKFGEYKKVIDAETGKAYRVPTRHIVEEGLRYKDLINFPLWSEG